MTLEEQNQSLLKIEQDYKLFKRLDRELKRLKALTRKRPVNHSEYMVHILETATDKSDEVIDLKALLKRTLEFVNDDALRSDIHDALNGE